MRKVKLIFCHAAPLVLLAAGLGALSAGCVDAPLPRSATTPWTPPAKAEGENSFDSIYDASTSRAALAITGALADLASLNLDVRG